MGENPDNRRESLEEIRRNENEAIERLRQKIKVAAEAKAAGTSSMTCPRCGGSLKETKFEEVMIDICENCGGVWLDSGELEQLTRRESGGFISRFWFAEG